MRYLVLVSLLWAFSFGLIKTYLTGLDPFVVSGLRMSVALLVFLPFLRIKTLSISLSWKFILIGGVQYGAMYGAYIYTYQFLEAHKIALFTVTTPLWVALVDDILEKRIQARFLLFALISVVGALVIYYKSVELEGAWVGIGLLQLSNLFFAIGQVAYRRLMIQDRSLQSRDHFAVLYFGGVVVTAILMLAGSDLSSIQIEGSQWLVILFLGAIASGLGFFLWNFGATQTNAGSLAVMNNLKIPLAVTVSLLFFESVSGEALLRLVTGGAIIVAAVFLNERYSRTAAHENE